MIDAIGGGGVVGGGTWINRMVAATSPVNDGCGGAVAGAGGSVFAGSSVWSGAHFGTGGFDEESGG